MSFGIDGEEFLLSLPLGALEGASAPPEVFRDC